MVGIKGIFKGGFLLDVRGLDDSRVIEDDDIVPKTEVFTFLLIGGKDLLKGLVVIIWRIDTERKPIGFAFGDRDIDLGTSFYP